jgi:hypothetical protein
VFLRGKLEPCADVSFVGCLVGFAQASDFVLLRLDLYGEEREGRWKLLLWLVSLSLEVGWGIT